MPAKSSENGELKSDCFMVSSFWCRQRPFCAEGHPAHQLPEPTISQHQEQRHWHWGIDPHFHPDVGRSRHEYTCPYQVENNICSFRSFRKFNWSRMDKLVLCKLFMTQIRIVVMNSQRYSEWTWARNGTSWMWIGEISQNKGGHQMGDQAQIN